MLVPKEIIRPGSYWYTDAESGEPRQLVVTPEMVRYWHEQGNKMLDAGLSVPIPFEHQADHKPLSKAERAAANLKNNSGFIQKYVIQDNDRLFGVCDIDDKAYPDLLKKLPRTIKYTSPWFTSFTDGDGKKWEGVIGHLALTNRPRVIRQEPFGDIAAALSLATTASQAQYLDVATIKSSGVYLSTAGMLDQARKPVHPRAFAVWSGVKLALAEEMEKVEDDDDDEAVEEKKGIKDANLEGKGKNGKSDIKKMGLIDVAIDVLDALFDIQLPEDTDEKNLLPHLIKACMAKLKGNGKIEEEDEEMETPATPTPAKSGTSEAPVMAKSPPVYMSLEEVGKITDPTMKRMAEMMLSLQNDLTAAAARNGALAKNVLDQATAIRQKRVEALARRLPKQAGEQLLAQAQGVALSLDGDGKVNDPLSIMLDILEAGTRDLPALLTQQGGAINVIDHPKDADGQISEERRKEIVASMLHNSGVERREKKAG